MVKRLLNELLSLLQPRDKKTFKYLFCLQHTFLHKPDTYFFDVKIIKNWSCCTFTVSFHMFWCVLIATSSVLVFTYGQWHHRTHGNQICVVLRLWVVPANMLYKCVCVCVCVYVCFCFMLCIFAVKQRSISEYCVRHWLNKYDCWLNHIKYVWDWELISN